MSELGEEVGDLSDLMNICISRISEYLGIWKSFSFEDLRVLFFWGSLGLFGFGSFLGIMGGAMITLLSNCHDNWNTNLVAKALRPLLVAIYIVPN